MHQSYQKPQKFKQISILVDDCKGISNKTKKTKEIFNSIENCQGKKLLVSTLDQDGQAAYISSRSPNPFDQSSS